jgi:prophage antirepressor-like protein
MTDETIRVRTLAHDGEAWVHLDDLAGYVEMALEGAVQEANDATGSQFSRNVALGAVAGFDNLARTLRVWLAQVRRG